MSKLQKVKTFFKGLTAVLAFFASIAGLTAFISLYISVQQFEAQQQINRQEEVERFANLMGSLQLEIEGNLDVCKKILAQKEKYLDAVSTPHNYFHYRIIEQVLADGEITDTRLRDAIPEKVQNDIVTERKFRVTLQNVCHRLITLNQLIAGNFEIMNHQVLVITDPQITAKTDYRLKSNSGMIIEGVEYVRDYLQICLPEVKKLNEHYSASLTTD